MQIAFHIGAHSTDDDLLLNCLRQNAGLLAQNGTLAPAGEQYRPVLREAVRRLQGTQSDPAGEEAVLEAILKGMDGRRLVMSSENFICVPQRVFDDTAFYGKMDQKAGWLRNVFPRHDVSFHIGLRSPATLVPALFERCGKGDFAAYLSAINLDLLSWFDVIRRLRFAVPDAGITIWCNEDTPLIWPEVLTHVAGMPEGTPLQGQHARMRAVLNTDGLERYLAYLDHHPGITTAQRRWAAISFLDRYGNAEEMEESYDLPDWTQDRIEALDMVYEEDLEDIMTLPDITVIRP
jgi:hypothetical protein